MKAKQRTKLSWEELESRLSAGEVPAIYMDRIGQLCLDDGTQRQIPAKLVPLFPASVVEDVKRRAGEYAAIREAEYEQRKQQLAEEEAELNERLDEKGFVLLAGEETEIVESGTLRQCRASLWKVTQQPRDEYAGKGCWVIVDSNGEHVQAGKFDAHGLV
tara:strand:+ start:977 stop:1456 length:480 start_codon:yes stop_codon:yes gene_type:complete